MLQSGSCGPWLQTTHTSAEMFPRLKRRLLSLKLHVYDDVVVKGRALLTGRSRK